MFIENFVYRDNQVGWMVIAGSEEAQLFSTEEGARNFIRLCETIDKYVEQGIPVASPIAELLDKDGPIPPDIRTESFSYRCLIAAGSKTNLLSVPPNIIRIESFSYRCRGIVDCDGHTGWVVIVGGKDDPIFTIEAMFTTEAEAKAYARARDAIGQLVRSTETKH